MGISSTGGSMMSAAPEVVVEGEKRYIIPVKDLAGGMMFQRLEWKES
jgi:hypothetical protein